MTPTHHPDHAVLMDFATGALASGARMVVTSHLCACPACRLDVEAMEAVGGDLLERLEPTALRDDALALALARIERPAMPEPGPEPAQADWIAVPTPVLRAAAKSRRWAAPGVWTAPIERRAGGGRSYLLRVAAGMRMPLHTHQGAEMVVVLKGAFIDGDRTYGPGDFACSDATVEHQPRITADGECVCLVAAQGPLQPRDWVGRLFQPFARI